MTATVSAAALHQLQRQHAHWADAVRRLAQQDNLAADSSWASLEQHLGDEVKQHLQGLTQRLAHTVEDLGIRIQRADTAAALDGAHLALLRFRHQYQKTETTLDFFADAVTTRTNGETSCLLRACDILAQRAMAAVLDPLNQPTPSVLTYLDKGLGAAILKQGLRLWDGGETNPVAAIRLVRHNILRPTSLIHEAGHQVAHILGWNEALAETLNQTLRAQGVTPEICDLWSSWASELAADALSFAHTG